MTDSLEEIRIESEEESIECLSLIYRDNYKQKLKFRCCFGHEFEVTWNVFKARKRGGKCIECNRMNRVKSIKKRICALPECNKKFKPVNEVQKFCCVKHQKIFNRRQQGVKSRNTNYDIFENDGFRCQYCGKTPKDGIKLVVDHIYPVSKGGKGKRFNLITSCSKCNRRKKDRLLPKEIILRLWEENEKSFSFEELEKYWKDNYKIRRRWTK